LVEDQDQAWPRRKVHKGNDDQYALRRLGIRAGSESRLAGEPTPFPRVSQPGQQTTTGGRLRSRLRVQSKSGLDARPQRFVYQSRTFNNKTALSLADPPPAKGPNGFDALVVNACDHRSGVAAPLLAFRCLDQLGKGGLVMYGYVSQDLAVQLDIGFFQAVDKAAVWHPVLAGGGIDARDPQAAEIALAIAPVAIGIPQRLHHRLVTPAPEAMFASILTFGQL
jgi:hypothetical protein